MSAPSSSRRSFGFPWLVATCAGVALGFVLMSFVSLFSGGVANASDIPAATRARGGAALMAAFATGLVVGQTPALIFAGPIALRRVGGRWLAGSVVAIVAWAVVAVAAAPFVPDAVARFAWPATLGAAIGFGQSLGVARVVKRGGELVVIGAIVGVAIHEAFVAGFAWGAGAVEGNGLEKALTALLEGLLGAALASAIAGAVLTGTVVAWLGEATVEEPSDPPAAP